MAALFCKKCPFRSKYDRNPESVLGRIWKWHTGWCPGWKAFLKSLPESERNEWIRKYHLKE